MVSCLHLLAAVPSLSLLPHVSVIDPWVPELMRPAVLSFYWSVLLLRLPSCLLVWYEVSFCLPVCAAAIRCACVKSLVFFPRGIPPLPLLCPFLFCFVCFMRMDRVVACLLELVGSMGMDWAGRDRSVACRGFVCFVSIFIVRFLLAYMDSC